ncbi:uncharacterized protein ColSpa_07451 [Colletotrichum spaethianum]|uniref:Uncharacterized protein n=1 Tax=Colletotrichum spaethianum TaxID=700344 RepID=A0AA37P1W2_9PEZI|nr:uncharacterized protein ColSpa_07451 [Colletotrichum spaethianum]GKT47270.1 hypothetical protein ColSpa_07451 [Colletotrichum spaethianum]
MPKQRAIRKTSGQWADLKPQICHLYATKKLEDVISHLGEQQKFVVTLGKWGCKKYNKGDEEEEDGDMDGSPESYEEDDADDITDNEEFPVADVQVTLDIQRANVLCAVSDGGSAWRTYCAAADFDDVKSLVALARSAETLKQCQMTLEILKQRVSQPSDAVTTSWCHLLYFHVCEAMSYGTGQNELAEMEEHTKESISAVVSSIIAGDGSPDGRPNFLFRESGSLDMIALAILDSIYEERFLLPDNAADDHSLETLLWQTDEWVLSGDRGQASLSPPILLLKQCAQWCQEQLFDVSEKLIGNGLEGAFRPNLRVSAREDQRLWRDHTEVFGTLWSRLAVQGRYDGAIGPEWSRACVRSLGVSYEELLSCMCWVILRFDATSRAVSGGDFSIWGKAREAGGDGGCDARELFERAEIAARGVTGWGSGDLWKAFLFAFRSVNSVTVTDGERGDVELREQVGEFKDALMTEFRAFVDMTLGTFDDGVGEDELASGAQMMLGMGPILPDGLGDGYIF